MADRGKADPKSGVVISNEVLADIAAAAAKEVQGVSALASRHGTRKRIRQESNLDFVRISGSEAELVLELWLRIKSDAKITVVAAAVQRSVKESVQTTTDKTVARVNLRIVGVDF